MNLNRRTLKLCSGLVAARRRLRVEVHNLPGGPRIIDCGVHARGGLETGRRLAEICMAGLGEVSFVAGPIAGWHGPGVAVRTDQPVAACMASQYAGWKVAVGDYFAMGSGPMRARAGTEAIFEKIGFRETAPAAVGVLEAAALPTAEVGRHLGEGCRLDPAALTLLAARTASQAGSVQIVARTVETALHKLMELGFDIRRVESGFGVAPLPPSGGDDLEAIGRTNDAVLYGANVTLWIRGDDRSLAEIGPRLPSAASPDHGVPFVRIFRRYNRDFYRIDPALFAPAAVTLVNVDTGRWFRFGEVVPELVDQSFRGE
jgi:methenyltetrahydromethanopterin cyclohydrolase